MRLSMIRTHLWPSLSETSGWLKSGPVCEVSQWPINNPSPQYGGSYTSKNNNAATWVSCLDTDCDPERHLYAFAASTPATHDYHFTPMNRQRPGASLTLDSAFLQKTIKIRRRTWYLLTRKNVYRIINIGVDVMVSCSLPHMHLQKTSLSPVHCALFCQPGQFGYYFYNMLPGPAHGRREYKWNARALVVDWEEEKNCVHLPRDGSHYQIKDKGIRLLCSDTFNGDGQTDALACFCTHTKKP